MMITFNFTPTQGIYFQKEKQEAKDRFYDCIGSLRDSFDEKNVTVTVDMSKKDFENKYKLTSNTTSIAGLMTELVIYKHLRKQNTALCM